MPPTKEELLDYAYDQPATIRMVAESIKSLGATVGALAGLLIAKGIITPEELEKAEASAVSSAK